MTNAQHTPGPWYSTRVSDTEILVQSDSVSNSDEPTIACLINNAGSDKEDLANAAFIVRACNSHDELVECLRHAKLLISAQAYYAPGVIEALNMYDAAIAKATGKE